MTKNSTEPKNLNVIFADLINLKVKVNVLHLNVFLSFFLFQVIAGQGFIVTGDLAEQMRLCAQLGSSAPVEHECPCLVLQEHLALKWATHIKTTAQPAPMDTTVKVGDVVLD